MAQWSNLSEGKEKFDGNISLVLSRHFTVFGHKDPTASIFPQAPICAHLLVTYSDGRCSEISITKFVTVYRELKFVSPRMGRSVLLAMVRT